MQIIPIKRPRILSEMDEIPGLKVSHERGPLAKKTASLIKKEKLIFTAEIAENAEKENLNSSLRTLRSLR